VRRLPGIGQKCSQEIRGMFGVVVLENQGEWTREPPYPESPPPSSAVSATHNGIHCSRSK
jgi:hypothetical protein